MDKYSTILINLKYLTTKRNLNLLYLSLQSLIIWSSVLKYLFGGNICQVKKKIYRIEISRGIQYPFRLDNLMLGANVYIPHFINA